MNEIAKDGFLSGCCIAAWMLISGFIARTSVVYTSAWELPHRIIAFSAATVSIVILGLGAASAVYLIGLKGPPDEMVGDSA